MKALCSTILLLLALYFEQVSVAAAEAPPKAKAVLLLAQSDGSQSTVNFGKAGVQGGELARLIQAPLAKLGITFVSTTGFSPMVGEPLPGLALGDEAAANLALQAGATLAVSVGIAFRSEGSVRSTQLVGQVVEVRVRVLDRQSGQTVFDTQLRQAGYGATATLAQEFASARALGKLMPDLAKALAARLPTASASGRAMSIQIGGAQGWREVGAIFRSLASTQGMEGMDVLEIRPDRVRLQIRSALSVSSLVAGLRRTRIPSGSVAVTANGNAILIELTITSSGQPILNG